MLNANYLSAARREKIDEYLPLASTALHARVRALGPRGEGEAGIKTLDIAKRLLDHGVHPPTVYFPLLVERR